MRLTTVVLTTSPDSEEVEFALKPLGARHRYILRAMVGIDAENLVPKFYGFGANTGKRFYEQTMPPREIVMRVALNPVYSNNEDVSDLRDSIYRLISSHRSGELMVEFRSGGTSVSAIKGMLTKMEVGYFNKTPELQITIECKDPMFRSINPVDIPVDELPTWPDPAEITDGSSTSPHGFSFKVKFTATTTTFRVQDDGSDPDWIFQVTPSTSFLTNDELHVSSEYGQKRVFWNKASGTDIDLMDKVTETSVWPQIFPGLNTLYFMEIANFDWLEFKFYSAFWGL
jgi:hypothetical protein